MDESFMKKGMAGVDKMAGGQNDTMGRMLLGPKDMKAAMDKINKDSKGKGVAGLYMPGGFRMEVAAKDEAKLAKEGVLGADAKERLKTGLVAKRYMEERERKGEYLAKKERELARKRDAKGVGFNRRWELDLEVADEVDMSKAELLEHLSKASEGEVHTQGAASSLAGHNN